MRHEGSYFTNIMASRSHTLYIGVTGNLRKRVLHKWKEHEDLTAKYNCDRLVWFESHQHNASQSLPRGTLDESMGTPSSWNLRTVARQS